MPDCPSSCRAVRMARQPGPLLLGPLQAAGPAARKPRPSMAIPERVGRTSGSLMGHSEPQRDIPDGIAGA
jgi:hypothetical protein